MPVFVNEFHYDNAGTDAGEFIEIAATAGTDLSGYTLVLYNGSNGQTYDSPISLSGIVADQQNGFGFVSVAIPGLQNGAPDGFALFGPGNVLVEFLSYEGSFTATNGPAAGAISVDVGVFEPGNANGTAVARVGSGTQAADFSWAVTSATQNATNTGQSFAGTPTPSTVSVGDATVVEGDGGTTTLVFTVTRSGGTGAFTVGYATADGTAAADSDYVAAAGTLSFAAGQTTQDISITVNGDVAVEGDETLRLVLSGATGATIGDGDATGTITNDDSATPVAQPFVNEFHYDNSGTDAGEFIEIAGAAGTNLSGYSLVLYNGSPSAPGTTYGSAVSLSGIIADQQGGYGTLSFAFPLNGLQNGGQGASTEPDGFALVGPGGQVLEFLSYEGVITATAGPAAGLTSVDVGVAEPGTAAGTSIARVGTGTSPADFTWTLATDDTPGAINAGQTFGQGTPRVSVTDITFSEGDAGTKLVEFTVVRNGGDGAFTVDYATANGSAAAGSDYLATAGTLSFAAGQADAKVQVTINGDTLSEGNETFFLNLSNATGGTSIADAQGQATILNDDAAPATTAIHAIQGDAHFSPILAGDGIAALNVRSLTQVTVTAVVTALDGTGARQGFYLMAPEAEWDANPLTSEGLFVMTRNDGNVGGALADVAPGVTVGETVTVSAYVMEYQTFDNLPRTVLVDPAIVAESNDVGTLPTYVLDGSAGRQIPNAILTDEVPNYLDSQDDAGDAFDPQNDALDFFETVEGMRVTLPDMVVGDGFVSGSDNAVRFKAYSTVHADADQINGRGGYTIAGDPPLSPPDTIDPEDVTNAGGRYLHDGDTNPDIVELDFAEAGRGGTAAFDQALTMGDRLGDVSGVIDFDFENVKLYVTDPVTLTDTQPVRETLTLADDARSLRVATFNVENLDPTDDTNNDEPDVAGTGKFNDLARAIATNLDRPDIISIEEIQDNNGAAAGDGISATGSDASITWTKLVTAVNAQTGLNYQWVDQAPVYNAEGGEQSGNIRVGFLYNTARVQLGDLDANATLAERRQFTDRIGDASRDTGDRIAFDDSQIAGEIDTADWSNTRKSLLGEFTFNGNTVYVLANHWPSKGGSEGTYQFGQNLPAGQPSNGGWGQRVNIADDVYAMLNRINTADTDARIVSGGDYNDFYFYRPLETVTGFVNPDGTARVGGARFDNLTVTDLPEAERFTYAFDGRAQAIDHIIADQALGAVSSYDVVHINTGYNERTGAVNPALSDHDPAVAQFDLRVFAERLAGGAAGDVLEGFGGNDTLIGNGGSDSLAGGAGDDRLEGGADGDIALFSGLRGDYAFARADGGLLVTDGVAGRDGADTLVEVEQLRFADGTTVAADQLFVGLTRIGSSARDTLTGASLDDRLYGYANNDQLSGLEGNDSLWGGQGNDTVAAGNGADRVHGGAGDDSVAGGAGADILVGGVGNDRLEGGLGADTFFFGRGEGRDVVTDYAAGQDFVALANGVAITSSIVGDYNADGQADLLVGLTGGGQATFYGVGAVAQLAVLTGQPLPITDIG